VAVSGCSNWNVTSYAGWATVTKYSYKIVVTVQANTGSARQGRILVGYTNLYVNQA
jgi:hypothetical protein